MESHILFSSISYWENFSKTSIINNPRAPYEFWKKKMTMNNILTIAGLMIIHIVSKQILNKSIYPFMKMLIWLQESMFLVCCIIKCIASSTGLHKPSFHQLDSYTTICLSSVWHLNHSFKEMLNCAFATRITYQAHCYWLCSPLIPRQTFIFTVLCQCIGAWINESFFVS